MDDTLGKDKSVEMLDKLKEETESIICDILEEGIKMDNIELLDKVVDIHKDIANEEYWEVKKEDIDMRYMRGSYNDRRGGNYGTYGRGRRRDSRGRYMEGGYSEGRRYSEGRGRRYQGHEMIDEMSEHYGNYAEGREEYGRGNYGAKEDTMKSLEYMLQSVEDFMMMLEEEATSQEEVEMVKHTARKIADM